MDGNDWTMCCFGDRPMNKMFVYVCMAAVALACEPELALSEHLDACADCGTAAQKCELVDRVIMVPKLCIETVMKTRCIQVKETRDETYTEFQMKPAKRQITKQHCYLVDEVRTKQIETEHCQIFDVPEITTYPPKECQTCEGKGKDGVEVSNGATDHGCRKVVANSTCKSEISYCVTVPKYKTEVCAEIDTYELVPVERTRSVAVCVPRIEEYPCEVTVKKWFPQTIKCCSACAVNHPKK